MNRPINPEDEHDWIEHYLNGQMTADERAVVETEMRTDPALQNEVMLLKRTHNLMQEAFLSQRAVSTLQQLQRQRRQQTGRIRLVSRSLAGGAGVCALLVLYLSLAPIAFPDSENDVNVTRSLAGDSSAVAQQRVFGQFFDGQAHLSEGQYTLAVKNFEQVLTAPDLRPYFREAAQWHLTVAYLKSGQADKAERAYDRFTDCLDCEYPVSRVDRWKIWWRIQWAKWI